MSKLIKGYITKAENKFEHLQKTENRLEHLQKTANSIKESSLISTTLLRLEEGSFISKRSLKESVTRSPTSDVDEV